MRNYIIWIKLLSGFPDIDGGRLIAADVAAIGASRTAVMQIRL
jgi:hypothetical protein